MNDAPPLPMCFYKSNTMLFGETFTCFGSQASFILVAKKHLSSHVIIIAAHIDFILFF